VAGRPQVDALFAGDLYCDLIFGELPGLPAPGSEVFAKRFAVVPGGTANRGVAAARLGLSTALAVTTGTDLFGDHLVDWLGTVPNLDLRWLRRDPAAHTPVSVAVTGETDRSFITYAEGAPGRPETLPAPPRVRVAHLGLAEPLPAWAAALRAEGTVLAGGVGWDGTGEWSDTVLARLSDVDIFCPNAVEAMRYTRTDSPRQAAKALAERVATVVVTLGGNGSLALDAGTGEFVQVPPVPVPVADPTGAGDVFVAAYLYGVLRGWPLADRLRFANLCAALSVRGLGGASSAPDWYQIRDFVAALPAAARAEYAPLEDAWAGHDVP
jgi:sugar/nucleoside kinase (ribokinase family)